MSNNPVLDALFETTINCRIKTKALGTGRIDKSASAKANNDHGAADNAGQVRVNRLAGADATHKAIISCQNAAKAVLHKYSQPFGEEEDGWKLLPNANLDPLVRELNPINTEFKELVQKVQDNVDDIINMAQRGIGGYAVNVPTREEMMDAYEMTVDFRPIPDSANFKGLNQNTIDKLKAMHDAKLEAAVLAAERNTLERFVTPVSNFIEGIKRYEERLERQADDPDDKKRDGIFRDTLITNIRDLHQQLDKFNISGDPRLTELGNLLASVAGIEPKQLRNDSVVREAAVTRAKEVAANLNSWLTK